MSECLCSKAGLLARSSVARNVALSCPVHTAPRPSSLAVEGFKWTNADGRSWYDGEFGPYEVGKTLVVKNAINGGDPCGRGIHIGKSAAAAIGYGKFPGRLFRVRGIGPVLGQDDTKWRFGSAEVLEELEKPPWVVETEGCIESIGTVKFFKPRRPPLKAWQHHPTRAAALAAALAAAWDAARAAALAAAWDAARAAALAAALAAAWDAALAAARAAALQARMAVVSDLKFKDAAKHRKHARDRWRVWTMGYGLACDVNGKLYTYDRP